MPIIAGALWKGNDVSTLQVIENFRYLIHKESECDKNILYDASKRYFLSAGKKKEESEAERVVILQDGLFIGRLFEKETGKHVTDYITLTRLLKADSQSFSQHYWGRYSIALLDKESTTITLWRDPLGLLSLFIIRFSGGVLFSSKLSLLYDALHDKPSLDWKYVASYIAYPYHLTLRSPFKDVIEVVPGHSITLSADKEDIQRSFWDFPSTTNIQDESSLITNFETCVNAWTQGIKTVYVELSGGVDSSSLLMVLKKNLSSTSTLVGINFFHPLVASSNEIEHAQKVASACDVPLHCINVEDCLPFSQLPDYRACKPSTLLLECAAHKAMASIVEDSSTSEVINGHGGDHLFIAPPDIDSLTDYILQRGVKGITSKVKELSAYYRMPPLRVITHALRGLGRYYRGSFHTMIQPYIQPWMLRPLRELVDSSLFKAQFLDILNNQYPAKAQHILGIYQATIHFDRGYKIYDKPLIYPFASQPFVERALSIPTYQLYEQGYDRFPFRQALSKYTMHDYIWRKTKGQTGGIVTLGVRKNIQRVYELALEGRCAQEKLIDKDLVYKEINEMQHGTCKNIWPVSQLLACEMWLNTWKL